MPIPIPSSIKGYDTLKAQDVAELDEIGSPFTMVGFGQTGDGDSGQIGMGGIKRGGRNVFSSFGRESVDGINVFAVDDWPHVLLSDFDSIQDEINTLEDPYILPEGDAINAEGDSGGPAFILLDNPKIAGIASGLQSTFGATNILGQPIFANFGDVALFTRVSSYEDFIETTIQNENVNRPYSLALDFSQGQYTSDGIADELRIELRQSELIVTINTEVVFREADASQIMELSVKTTDQGVFQVPSTSPVPILIDAQDAQYQLVAEEGNHRVNITSANVELPAGTSLYTEGRPSIESLGQTFTGAFDVNEDGSVIVGYRQTDRGTQALKWMNGVVFVLPGFPGLTSQSRAETVSADGNIVAGYAFSDRGREAVVWRGNAPPEILGSLLNEVDDFAVDMSADGEMIVGFSRSFGHSHAFIWQESQLNVEGLGIHHPQQESSRPGAISGSGNFVVGISGIANHPADGHRTVGFGYRPNGGRSMFPLFEDFNTAPTGLSFDGETVVGDEISGFRRPFRATSENGVWDYQFLNLLPELRWGSVSAISDDGSVIVGMNGHSVADPDTHVATIWEQASGFAARALEEYLESEYGVQFNGRQLRNARAMSRDGSTIIVEGNTTDGIPIRYVIRIPESKPLLTVSAFYVNSGIEDPPSLDEVPQPSRWLTQRSALSQIEVKFSAEIIASPDDFQLSNLGKNPAIDSPGQGEIAIDEVIVDGDSVTLRLPRDLEDGVFKLQVLPSVTTVGGMGLDGSNDGTIGDPFVVVGTLENGLFQLTGDWNGDGGISVFDFGALSYWFGQSVPIAPSYMDLNRDGAISIFDFVEYLGAFGDLLHFPVPGARKSLTGEQHSIQLEHFSSDLKATIGEWWFWNEKHPIGHYLRQRDLNNQF